MGLLLKPTHNNTLLIVSRQLAYNFVFDLAQRLYDAVPKRKPKVINAHNNPEQVF